MYLLLMRNDDEYMDLYPIGTMIIICTRLVSSLTRRAQTMISVPIEIDPCKSYSSLFLINSK